MEKVVGIIGDVDNEVTKALLEGWGQTKYKIYRSPFREDSYLVFQTNDKELFISQWIKEYRSVMAIDGVNVSFTIGNFGHGGSMGEQDLRKYLDELDKK